MTYSLDVLNGTDYTVSVTRNSDLSYTVQLSRPPRAAEREMFHVVYGKVPDVPELVDARTLNGSAGVKVLERLVEDMIAADSPSLVGVYVSETNEEEEEDNE